MTLGSAYIELFSRGKSPGEMSGGNVRKPCWWPGYRTSTTAQSAWNSILCIDPASIAV